MANIISTTLMCTADLMRIVTMAQMNISSSASGLLALFSAPTVRHFSAVYLISIEVTLTSFVVAQSFHQTHVIRKQSVKYQVKCQFLTLALPITVHISLDMSKKNSTAFGVVVGVVGSLGGAALEDLGDTENFVGVEWCCRTLFGSLRMPGLCHREAPPERESASLRENALQRGVGQCSSGKQPGWAYGCAF
eukprot:gene190-334_t